MAGRLYRRGGVWYCWGYDARGTRWRESTKQPDRKAAEIVSREISRRRAFKSTEAPPVPLKDALVRVGEADARAGRSEARAQMLRQKGRQLVAFFGPDFDLARMERADLERYADKRVAEVSRHTIAIELGFLRRAARVAGLPWTDALMPDLGAYYVPRKRWLPWGEYLALHAALAPERRAYLEAYCYSGARRSELYAVTAADVDLTRDLLHLRGEKTAAAERWVPIHPALRTTLERLMRATPTGPLFPWWTNDVRDLSAACKRAEIDGLTPNDLRRTFCSWLANAGVSTLVAARLMGHTSTRMVERVYAQLGVEIKADAISRLPGVYNGEPRNTDLTGAEDTVDDDEDPDSP